MHNLLNLILIITIFKIMITIKHIQMDRKQNIWTTLTGNKSLNLFKIIKSLQSTHIPLLLSSMRQSVLNRRHKNLRPNNIKRNLQILLQSDWVFHVLNFKKSLLYSAFHLLFFKGYLLFVMSCQVTTLKVLHYWVD